MNMNNASLLYLIILPSVFAVLMPLAPTRFKKAKEAIVLAGFAVNLALVLMIYGKDFSFVSLWSGAGLEFSLKLYHFSGFILLCAALITFLVVVYTTVFLKDKAYSKLFYACLLFTLSLVNGAVLANNLVVMLFFWEGILATMFVLIALGGKNAYKTSVKALVIAGLGDLCMMLGIGLLGWISGTLSMDGISRFPLSSPLAISAFILLLIGAVSKAGAMPFHTWIPDAANDAPLPFMAFMPGTLEKLLGIYLLTRICVDFFDFTPGSAMSLLLMSLGAVTVLFGVMMALVQKDFKRLLSYHAVSQVGYMLLGIGTALPVGIIGGLFHMLNNAVYKCCLFLTAGSVERQAGTTDMRKISGLGKQMPYTFGFFVIAAASIAGFPLTNGFFSKELIFDGAVESGLLFYIIAVVGAFFTAVSFLKLGHAVFLGKPAADMKPVKEAPVIMLIPMGILSLACLLLGFGQSAVISSFLQPVLHKAAEAGEHIGSHTNWLLAGISVGVLTLALIDHLYGFRKTGKGLEAADHFHDAPGLRTIYKWAGKKLFDPYHLGGYFVRAYAAVSLRINDGISSFYDIYAVRFVGMLSGLVRKAHNGNQARYVLWAVAGLVLVAAIFLLPL